MLIAKHKHLINSTQTRKRNCGYAKLQLLNVNKCSCVDFRFSILETSRPVNAGSCSLCFIEHPFEGLVLHKIDGGNDYLDIIGPSVQDVFSRVNCDTCIVLDKQFVLEEYNLENIKTVTIEHLHIDLHGR
jgi:hypothetical protein